MLNWEMGLFKLRAAEYGAEKKHENTIPVTTAGWYNDLFGITRTWLVVGDREIPVYLVHHIPTGWSIVAFDGSLQGAFDIAEKFLMFGDWTFTDPITGVEPLKEKMGAEFQNNTRLVNPGDCLPTLWLDSDLGELEVAK